MPGVPGMPLRQDFKTVLRLYLAINIDRVSDE